MLDVHMDTVDFAGENWFHRQIHLLVDPSAMYACSYIFAMAAKSALPHKAINH